jgi:hypothetical protein
MVSKEQLDKFKSLYQRKYNTSLTDEEATKMTTDLLNLMRVLIKPLPKQNNNETYLEGEK